MRNKRQTASKLKAERQSDRIYGSKGISVCSPKSFAFLDLTLEPIQGNDVGGFGRHELKEICLY